MANESEIRSLMSLSSKSDLSTAAVTMRTRWRNAPLHERCSMADMVKIKEAFQAAYLNKLLPNDFRDLLRNLLNVEYDDEEFKILFMKVHTFMFLISMNYRPIILINNYTTGAPT